MTHVFAFVLGFAAGLFLWTLRYLDAALWARPGHLGERDWREREPLEVA